MDLVSTIIDRVIALLKERDEFRREVFENHVEPIFLDLTLVHKDYADGFEEACHIFWDHRIPNQELTPRIQALKNRMEYVRAKLQPLAAQLKEQTKKKKHPEEIAIFAESVRKYFDLGGGEGSTLCPVPGSTYYTTLLDLIIMIESQTISRQEAEKWVGMFYDDVRDRWSSVTMAYANARMKCLR